jgi:hypothetical protein
MSALSRILRDAENNMLMFWCPGCDSAHGVRIGAGEGPRWLWNGDVEKPTFSPSLLVRYEHWVPPHIHGQAAPEKQTKVTEVCHSFIKDGRIQFLSDCTHAFAGQTVDIPDFD